MPMPEGQMGYRCCAGCATLSSAAQSEGSSIGAHLARLSDFSSPGRNLYIWNT